MKCLYIAFAALAATTTVLGATPSVSDVTLTQKDNGSYDVTYTLTDAPAVVTFDIQVNSGSGYVSVGDINLQRSSGDVNRKVTTAVGKFNWMPTTEAKRKLASGTVRAEVKAWPMDDTPDYMCVSLLSSVASAEDRIRYYTSSNAIPGGVLGNLDYRTCKILLRKIKAKGVTWWMGADRNNGDGYHDPSRDTKHKVTLDHNYYFAVFPLTQSQVRIIKGDWMTTAFKNETRALRLQDTIRYTDARGTNYPEAPSASSVLGKLRTLTGGIIDFELPCESEWEFASRAGNGTGYWNNGDEIDLVWGTPSNIDDSKNVNGRYNLNQETPNWQTGTIKPSGASGSWVDWGAPSRGIGDGTPVAGSYAPNSWGIYDTSGGVWEFCNDWYQLYADIANLNGIVNVNDTDTSMPCAGEHPNPSDPKRVIRGGSWADRAFWLVPGNRQGRHQNYNDTYWDAGIRVMCRMGLK